MQDYLLETRKQLNLNKIKIRKADILDMDLILAIIDACRDELNHSGIAQWTEEYPDTELIISDILSNEAYVLEFYSTVVAYMVLNDKQDEEYKLINWKINSDNVLVVHRLAVNPKFQGRGFGKYLMNYAEGLSLEKSKDSIRLDVYSANKYTISFYEKRDYKFCGEVFFKYRNEAFLCYEKIFKSKYAT